MHLHVKSGICIYTVREYHVCVNLAIPRKNGLIVQILSDIADFVSDTYPGHTIDMRSLKTHVCELHGCCIQYRRVVPSLSHIQDMQLSEDRMWIHILGKKTKVHSLVKSRQQLYDLLPITRFSVDDDEETLYWFRFECGSVVLFKNPSLEEDVPPIPFVCITDQDMILKHTAPGLVCVVESLSPSSVSQCMEMINTTWVPVFVKELCLQVANNKIGLCDELIMIFGFMFSNLDADKPRTDSFSGNVMSMFYLMKKLGFNGSNAHTFDLLVKTLCGYPDQKTWRTWMMKSSFIFTCVEQCDQHMLCSMCNSNIAFKHVLIALLYRKIGTWTTHQKQKQIYWKACLMKKRMVWQSHSQVRYGRRARD